MESSLSLPLESGPLPAFVAAPDSMPDAPGILLIHEIWGLNDNIRSVARRLAAEGYAVIAPDLLTGTPIENAVDPSLFAAMQDPDTKDEAQKQLRAALAPTRAPSFGEDMMLKLRACLDYLRTRTQTIATMGFCFGGTYSFVLAAEDPDLSACVVFYGQAPSPERIAKIRCPVLAFYGAKDEALMATLPQLRQTMDEHGVQFSHHVYPETGHAFFNDSNTRMYNLEAAQDAWKRTVAFLGEHLKGITA